MLLDLGLASIPRSDVWVVVSGAMDQRAELTKSIVREHYALITTNPVLFTDAYGTYTIDGKLAYFQRLAVGWDRYGYSWGAWGAMPWPTENAVAA